MKTVAIIHGWAGGNWLNRQLISALEGADFKYTSQTSSADIIIAHSAGAYRLPNHFIAKTLMLVGLPYWPELPVSHRLRAHRKPYWQRIRNQKGWLIFIKTLLLRTLSVIIHPSITLVVITNHKKLDILENNKQRNIILVRNQSDLFTSPDLKNIASKYSHVKYFELPGYHEDIYDNPVPYIDLLRKEL